MKNIHMHCILQPPPFFLIEQGDLNKLYMCVSVSYSIVGIITKNHSHLTLLLKLWVEIEFNLHIVTVLTFHIPFAWNLDKG